MRLTTYWLTIEESPSITTTTTYPTAKARDAAFADWLRSCAKAGFFGEESRVTTPARLDAGENPAEIYGGYFARVGEETHKVPRAVVQALRRSNPRQMRSTIGQPR